MRAAAARMRTLINDLLTYARVTTQARPFQEVDLSAVARETVADLEGRIQQTQGRVELGELPRLEADPVQMHELLLNLIGNGLKFHRHGEPPVVRVEGRLLSDGVPGGGPHCELTVRDNGIGFEETYRERIFEVFRRLHGRTEYEGTGIGLAICRKIVERHGGTITACSAPGQGAAFVVNLPVRQGKEETSREQAP
jgi:signal transduction histidine kinase